MKNSEITELLGVLILAILVIGVSCVIVTGLFEIVWNDFIVSHVTGASTTTFGSAFIPALCVSSLCGGGFTLNRKRS